jgi:F-type H+-transporting ATPase subunit b
MAPGSILASEFNPILPAGDELVVGTIAFLLIFFVFWRKLLPNIRKTLEERTDLIEGGMQRAEEAQAAANELQEQYRRQLAEARHEAAKIREHANEQAAQIVADMRADGQNQREALIASGHAQLDADAAGVRAALKGDLGRLAVELAGKIVGESLEDEARQRRTVDRFLDELESKLETANADTTATRPSASTVGAS